MIGVIFIFFLNCMLCLFIIFVHLFITGRLYFALDKLLLDLSLHLPACMAVLFAFREQRCTYICANF